MATAVTILGQNQRPGFGPGNQPIDFIDILFQVNETGDTGMISIPVEQYTSERAVAEVQTRANALTATRQLLATT